jgi:saccharopine dehydrogenase-like NADP-dependent oxidoreductase
MIIPTAEEFLRQKPFINGMTRDDQRVAMIEFAKLHVAAALNEAANEADVTVIDVDMTGVIWGVDVNTILKAYPLENIK